MVVAAIALVAIAAWPYLGAGRASASRAYFAPVLPDYSFRDKTIAFYEKRVRDDTQDQISARLLAGEYMQRYREQQDVGDILRSIHQNQRALVLQPQNAGATFAGLASAQTALHHFSAALALERKAHLESPFDSNAPAQMASLEMELGHYDVADRDLTVAHRLATTPTIDSVQARYDELNGKLEGARALIARAMIRSDDVSDNSAQGRAWYHFRAGELAFSSGAVDEAKADEREALVIFPGFEMAYRALARFCWATKDWNGAIDAATKGVAIIPEPETLGYLADAQAALGQTEAAKQTQGLIFAVERVGNAYNINDRLLSVYYAEHGIRLEDAYAIAQREVRSRGDEVYAQDTLAWAAAMDGKWAVADAAAKRATRLNTQDPRILFHAGAIAAHFGRTGEARTLLQAALRLNPTFDPFYAERASTMLRASDSRSSPTVVGALVTAGP